MTNRGRISETFMNYEAKALFRKLVKHVGKRLVAEVSETRRKTNHGRISENITNYEAKGLLRNGFDVPIGVVKAWEERGSFLHIFRMTNRGQILETFRNYEGKDLLRIVVKAWEERRSCLNIFRTINRCRISETFKNYEAKDLLGIGFDVPIGVFKVWEEHGSCIYISGRQIAVGSQKTSRITRQKTCYASELNMSVRVVFVNRSGFDIPIGVVKSWEERGSCLNIFRMISRGPISETFRNYEAKDMMRK
ncbi:uncharacterized protein G2W53_022004 [Senna tora]|uniref:Uncharacterized protein n=1 Tax=Senna tora TaxID=362788 RepID=A0A834TL76_9FABA|nr:uncharacterized protein G2W53_022004 [Senna tora]